MISIYSTILCCSLLLVLSLLAAKDLKGSIFYQELADFFYKGEDSKYQ